MTAEQHYKEWYAQNQGLDLTSEIITSLDRDIINVMSSYAKQESIEFADWFYGIVHRYINFDRFSERYPEYMKDGKLKPTNELYEEFQKTKLKQ
jgi:hypothetical protein